MKGELGSVPCTYRQSRLKRSAAATIIYPGASSGKLLSSKQREKLERARAQFGIKLDGAFSCLSTLPFFVASVHEHKACFCFLADDIDAAPKAQAATKHKGPRKKVHILCVSVISCY